MANILYYLLPCAVFLVVVAYHGPDLPPGPYCGITGECCKDRKDSCAHMILDTLCYCDQHCNRTHDDCCPDYEEVCLGVKTTPAPDNYTLPDICREGQKKMERCYPCTCRRNQYGELDWECQPEACMIDDYIVNEINRGGFSWRAANYSEFYGKTLKDGLVYKLGTLPLSPETRRMGPIRYNKEINYPTTFDARVRWPGFISPVIDQGWCGSDWAIAIAGVASDRLAIQSNGAETVVLSPQTLLSCNIQDQKGCEGGYIDNAWNFVRGHGLVDEPCLPYQASVTPCPFKRRGNLLDDGCNPLQKRTSRYKVGPPGLLRVVEDIMYDIMDSGPVHAIMSVHQDFFHYREGVYRQSPFGNQNYKGLHSVRIVGWGEDRGDKYWIVANSWGRQWGEDGYFRIARGSSESGIESFVVTVLSEVSEA